MRRGFGGGAAVTVVRMLGRAFALALALGTVVFGLMVGAPDGADAQNAQSPIIVEPPATPPAQPIPSRTYEYYYRRQELAWRALRSRNALIATSAATAVGAALVFPAEANQCNSLEFAEMTGTDRCTPGGKAMVAIGYPLLVFGIIGVLGSGIAFGVAKGRLRKLDDRVASKKARAVRWDPARARFVF